MLYVCKRCDILGIGQGQGGSNLLYGGGAQAGAAGAPGAQGAEAGGGGARGRGRGRGAGRGVGRGGGGTAADREPVAAVDQINVDNVEASLRDLKSCSTAAF